MKILPRHENLRSLIYWLVSLQGLTVFFFSYWIAYSFRAQILWLFLALFFIFTPWASCKPQTNLKTLPFIRCLGLTFILQIALILAFYTICDVTEFGMPVGPVPFALFQTTALILLTNWGVFPWGVYALLAVALSYTAYIKQQPADMSTLLRPLVKNTAADTISLAIDFSTKIAIAFSLASTLGFIAMECMTLIAQFFRLPIAYGVRPDVLIALLVILKWNQDTSLAQPLNWLVKHKVPNFWLVSGFLILVSAGLMLTALLIGWASPKFTPLLSRAVTFAPNDWAFVWATFAGIWWLGWAPLAAGMLAYIWRGYSMRVMVLCTLLLPVTVGLFLLQYPDWLNINLNSRLWNFVPAIVSAIVIILLFLRSPHVTYIAKAVLPAGAREYQRSPKLFLTRLLQGTIMMMCLYWAGGAYLPGVTYFVVVFPASLFAMLAGTTIFKSFYMKQK